MKKQILKTLIFDSGIPGPSLLILGGIHGNEVCGPEAIERVTRMLHSGQLPLKRGRVTFAPVCNPKAYANKVRFISHDLNRIIKKTSRPHTYEQKLANEICALIDACDALLDIHSITAQGTAFAYMDYPTVRNKKIALSLGVPHVLVGWPALHAKKNPRGLVRDTVAYAHNAGKDTVTVECGQHAAKKSVSVATRAIVNTLIVHSMTDTTPHAPSAPIQVRLSDVFFRQKNQTFAKKWRHLSRVRKGDVLIQEGDKNICAPYDCFVIMPNGDDQLGRDWLYLGRPIA